MVVSQLCCSRLVVLRLVCPDAAGSCTAVDRVVGHGTTVAVVEDATTQSAARAVDVVQEAEAFVVNTGSVVGVDGIVRSVVDMGLERTIAADNVGTVAWEEHSSSRDATSSGVATTAYMVYARGACHCGVARAPAAHNFACLTGMICRPSPTISIATYGGRGVYLYGYGSSLCLILFE